MSKTILAVEFITYDGQPGSRPPFSDPVNCEKLIAIAQAPLPHDRGGELCTFMLIPVWKNSPVDVGFLCFYDQEQPESCEWYSSCPIFADGEHSLDDLVAEYGEGAKVDENGYLCFPLKKGDRWMFWPALPGVTVTWSPSIKS